VLLLQITTVNFVYPRSKSTAVMATPAHCAYCFESLVARFENRQPLSLSRVEELWAEQAETKEDASGVISSSSSYPLFVTWNTISRSNSKSLRGCIGTFAPKPLEAGLHEYALTSAFDDERFPPIPQSQLAQLQCCVTLLTNFSNPTSDPMAWEIGKHGIRISFTHHGRTCGATYLPDVAKEQGWTKEEAIVSLMRKAGWSGRKDEWKRVTGMQLITYEGKKVDMNYAEFNEWRDMVKVKGV
jgi:uncharacterized protein (TIGR00296 family)